MARPRAVRVGHDQSRRATDRIRHAFMFVGYRGGVANGRVAIDQARRGSVYQAVAAAGHEHHSWCCPNDRTGFVELNEFDGRGRPADAWIADSPFVGIGNLRPVEQWFTEPNGRGEAGGVDDEVAYDLRPSGSESVESVVIG